MPDYHTLIVGAGFSGIGTAVNLDKAGLSNYLIVEAGDGVGGTWYWNSYPGVAVDIPSFSYQFSFEQSPDWSRTYAPGRELRAYAERCVDKYRLRSRIRFNAEVSGAVFDDDENVWRVALNSGEVLTARFLVNGSGVLTIPKLPDIDGVDSFAGITMHTARWDHTQDLAGKRVAIIGTGATAVQVIPEIAPIVQQLTVFQRTPIWCFPKFDVPLPPAARWAMRIPGGRTVHRLISQAYVEFTFPLAAQYFTVNPFAKRADAIGKTYLRKEVQDPAVRDKLTPRYAVGCKRPGFHNTYLSTFNRDNVTLVTESIDKITGSGVATTDGETHDVDVVILATGFKVMDVDAMTFDITGPGGQTLSAFWEQNRMQAYEGVSVPGFPNYFTVMGPYGYVGSSYFALIEAQTHHLVRCIAQADRRAARRVEVRQEANDRYFAEMMRKRHRQIFWQDSCAQANSYYFDRNGDVPLRPASTPEAYWRSRSFDLDDYRFTG
jgi:cation diffusion facilitator CzcD-associated flavoprotein CzcO